MPMDCCWSVIPASGGCVSWTELAMRGNRTCRSQSEVRKYTWHQPIAGTVASVVSSEIKTAELRMEF